MERNEIAAKVSVLSVCGIDHINLKKEMKQIVLGDWDSPSVLLSESD